MLFRFLKRVSHRFVDPVVPYPLHKIIKNDYFRNKVNKDMLYYIALSALT
jgi:hypothetical protein